MGDESWMDAGQPVKIVGASSTGTATNPVNSDSSGNLFTRPSSNGTPGSTLPSNTTAVGGKDASGNLQTDKVDANGSKYAVITNQTDGTKFAQFTNNNRLKINIEGTSQIADKFDGSTLDTNQWAATVNGTGTATVGGGSLVLTTGTTASNYAYITSVPTVAHPGNAFIQFGAAIKLETSLTTNTRRHWGFAINGGTYASPLTDGVVFEVDENAILRASIYNSGTRTFTQVLTAPTDGNFHRYDIYYNTQNISWYIDASDVPLASVTNGTNPSIQTLNLRLAMFNNTAAAPAAAPTLQCQAIAATDTASNNLQISDGKYGFRKASVSPNNDVFTRDVINSSFVTGALSVTTTAQELKAGATRLTNRKVVSFRPTNGTIYFGYNSSVTTTTGFPVYSGERFTLTFTDNIPVYVISAGTVDTRVAEGS